ncbi:signal transduction histidine kinase [Phyllobacterium sp. 1468]|uniref:sensor histidine kinase n=1 Tax=Phyllobacterium sp. 1468 TaxID=2817759 RepID=UPI001B752284|nr:sensor histidine kinase [Phyllobacterium sp. 1468]MDR6633046.1 signal transduction histidine kinase [Phyllobacterium sp. 1468]
MNLLTRWNSQSLARQFLLIGGLVSVGAMILIGAFVAGLIEAAVTRNSAAATALYVDSVVAPILPDMQTNQMLDETVTRALDETLGQGALASRLVSFRLWRSDGLVLYSNDKTLMGKRFAVNDDLKTAFAGKMVANFNNIDDVESEAERASGKPLLEIYNPVLQPWSGKVVAVSEFYEIADEFQHSLDQARLRSWLAVAFFTLAFFLVLSAIVFRGSKTIDDQRRDLKQRVSELSDLLLQNKTLHARVQRASQRAAALNESYLRRIGADIHDGPAQLMAFAALRLDSDVLVNSAVSEETREGEVMAIKESLDEAMREIRNICDGLVLPHIEAADLPEIIRRAVKAHEYRTGSSVDLSISGTPVQLEPSVKICIYRFIQEGLNNGFQHGGGIEQRVVETLRGERVVVEVSDGGPGFDPATVGRTGIGLAGLRDRVESLGGHFTIESSAQGTKVRMSLNLDGLEQA